MDRTIVQLLFAHLFSWLHEQPMQSRWHKFVLLHPSSCRASSSSLHKQRVAPLVSSHGTGRLLDGVINAVMSRRAPRFNPV
jgi:hypothetical protein